MEIVSCRRFVEKESLKKETLCVVKLVKIIKVMRLSFKISGVLI